MNESIYSWNLSGLVTHLKQDKHHSAESYRYLFCFIAYRWIFAIFNSYFLKRINPSPEVSTLPLALITTAVAIFISFLILRRFYLANGGSQGRFFLDRLLALGWVLTLRSSIVVLPALTILLSIQKVDANQMGSTTITISFICLAAMVGGVWYFIRNMIQSLTELAKS